MARTKAPAKPQTPPLSRATVAASLERKDYTLAVEQARELHRSDPSAENLALLKSTIVAVASQYASSNRVIDFNRTMGVADEVDPTDAVWAGERACLLALGGRLADALMRADDATRPKVLALAADRAIRLQSKDFLPDDLHAGFDAVIAAFQNYESNNDEAARQALEAIGLRSPFLEWKLLLRGLMAHAASDDERAVENFSRLDSARLPAKLAEPYRAAIDKPWKESLPPAHSSALHGVYQKLNAAPLAERLRDIARKLGGAELLAGAFRALESMLSPVKHQQPHLVPRLANCFYHAILQKGVPEDMSRYRKLFGAPPDDPQFNKLQAIIEEHCNEFERAIEHWGKYEKWLESKPAGWPDDVRERARAHVWMRMGSNAQDIADDEFVDEDEEDFDPLYISPSPAKGRLNGSSPDLPQVASFFQRAAELAPEWPAAVLDHCRALRDLERFDEAGVALKRLLEHQPDDLETANELADLLQERGEAAEASAYRLRAAALNPLDKALRSRAAQSVLAHARMLLPKQAAEIAPLLEKHREWLDEYAPSPRDAVAAVAAAKLGRADEAQTLRVRAQSGADCFREAGYRIAVDSILAKLKPADKKTAEKLFADSLADPAPTAGEVRRLIEAYQGYIEDGVKYRSQKTHLKKILPLVERSLRSNAPQIEFENLAIVVQNLEEWKLLKKFSDGCVRRFKDNPVFFMTRAQAGFNLNENAYRLTHWLDMARQALLASQEPRHREMLGRIEEMLESLRTPFSLFDSFFGREV